MAAPTTTEFAAFIGIDWADRKHDVCLLPAGSSTPQFSVLPHRPEAIAQWAQQLCQRFGGALIAVCLELAKGPLVYALQRYPFLVLFPVNPTTLAKYRQAFHVSGAKDDPSDASADRRQRGDRVQSAGGRGAGAAAARAAAGRRSLRA